MNTATGTPISNLARGWHGQPIGILSDHIDQATSAGLSLHFSRGAAWLYDPRTSEPAVPVLCSEVIQVWTEDGPETSRCGARVTLTSGEPIWCEGHDMGPAYFATCPHGMSAALCVGPSHYPLDM